MEDNQEFGRAYAAAQILKSRNPLRRIIKWFYVSRVVSRTKGKTIDLGCGAGQILARLPAGSMGIEINPYLVDILQTQGLRVMVAAPCELGFNLDAIVPGEFNTLVLSHVLEHFLQANIVLKTLLADCARLGISKVIVVVPTTAGYRSDLTHKTYVDDAFLKAHALDKSDDFELSEISYFPWNSPKFGDLFTYHEMMAVFNATAKQP